jgi:NitT/TauT family transport system permease protein
MKNSIWLSRVYSFAAVLALVIIWKVVSLIVASEILLPSPEVTLKEVIRISQSNDFINAVLRTTYRSLVGFGIAFFSAMLLAVLANFWKPLSYLLNPLVLLTKTTPTMSIILLALIWFTTETAPVLIGFLVIFPILYANISTGLKNVDNKLVQMSELFKVSRKSMVNELYIPSVVPYLLSASSTAIALNLKVIIAAEVLSQPKYAIGTAMQLEKIYLNTAGVFAWTLVAIILSAIFDGCIHVIKILLERWK